MRYFLKLRYHGGNYHGWQIQPNAVSVQEVVNMALSNLLRNPIETTGCGRTDTGVHAKEFYLHFDFDRSNLDLNDSIYKLNSMNVKGVEFISLHEMKEGAHTRFDALSRSYQYWIILNRDPFSEGLAYYYKRHLNVQLMNEACSFLIGEKDFSCFSKSNTQVATNLCNITYAKWEVFDNRIVFHITANRFLRNMVRAIVGTLLEIGEEKKPPGWMKDVLESKSRGVAGTSVPACGLYLSKVIYPENYKV